MYDYSHKDVVRALRSVGLTRGSVVYTHSNVGFWGQLEGARSAEDIYGTIKSAVFEVIGTEGTWVVPTFSYSFCWGKVFDPDATPGVCGLLSEHVRKDKDSLRSFDANFSVSALGKQAKYLTQEATAHSFGPGSFWERFLNAQGTICNFNFDAGSTFIHFVEKKLNVPYRFDKAFPGMFQCKGKEEKKIFYHFVYDQNKAEHAPDFTKIDAEGRRRGMVKLCDLGRGQVIAICAQDTFDLINTRLKDDPDFLIRGKK